MHTVQHTYIEGNKSGNSAAKEIAAIHEVHFTGFSNGDWRIGNVSSSLAEPIMNEVKQNAGGWADMKIVKWTFIGGSLFEYEAALEVALAHRIIIRDQADGSWSLGPIVSSSQVGLLLNEIQQNQGSATKD